MSEVSKSEADRERVNPIDEVIRGFKTVEEWQRYCLDAVDFKDILESSICETDLGDLVQTTARSVADFQSGVVYERRRPGGTEELERKYQELKERAWAVAETSAAYIDQLEKEAEVSPSGFVEMVNKTKLYHSSIR